MAKNPRLNERQLAVLRWVTDGRPKGVYTEGFEHRITARALERRGLVAVGGHGPSWRASVTDDGRYYLEHDHYPPSPQPEPLKASVTAPATRKSPPKPEPIDDLLDRVEAASGVVRIDSPSEVERASYRRAAELVRASGDLRPSQRLRISGIKRGPLTVELIQLEDAPVAADAIPVPPEPDLSRRDLRALSARPSLLAVSDETRPRALALVQAIADECARRGWVLTVDDAPSFLVSVREDGYRCVLLEEREKRDVFDDEEVAERKYAWQRVSPTRREVYSGRLRLEVGPAYDKRWWADRRRWTLASRLPDVFAAIDELSGAARDLRDRKRRVHEQQVSEWEEAVPRAREAYLRARNAERAQKQASAWREARALQDYAEAVTQRAAELDGDERSAAASWAAWLRAEAVRVDPLTQPTALRLDEPDSLGPAELDPHMPHRWTVRRPPDPPTYLPP